MRIALLVLLLLGAHLSLTALVPLQIGDVPPPWWVGGRLLWPFAEDTNTLLVSGDTLNAITPILASLAGLSFLLAAAALLRWRVPAQWFRALVAAGVACSIVLQVVWLTGWAVLPLLVDAALLWLVFGRGVTVRELRQAQGS